MTDEIRKPDESTMQGEIVKQLPGQKSSNPTSYRSVATMTNDQIVGAAQGQPDLLRGMVGIVKEEQLPAHQRSILEDQLDGLAKGRRPRTITSLSGTADPQLEKSGIVIGCKVYHKERKMEGKVIDVSVKSGVKVRRSDKVEQWWNPKYLVKL